jgi:hypothetical protein
MPAALTSEEFAQRARQVHGKRYDYTQAVYQTTDSPVVIICKECNMSFKQTPHSHLRGYGCFSCGRKKGAKKKVAGAAQEFVSRARKVHGDRYGYEKVCYRLATSPVQIVCRRCDAVFCQTPDAHLAGCGCKTCSLAEASKRKVENAAKQFEFKARKVHGCKYGYEHVTYINAKTPVEIFCRSCESRFHQTPTGHLAGYGCNRCGRKRTTEKQSKTTTEFIEQAKEVAPEFDYSSVVYVRALKKVVLRCNRCLNEFKRVAAQHLYKPTCPHCARGQQTSRGEKAWLNSLSIPRLERQFKVPGTNYVTDGYDPDTNTVYELLGDFWHGNPEVFDHDKVNPVQGSSFKALFDQTMERLQFLESLGYNVVYIWENDFRIT